MPQGRMRIRNVTLPLPSVTASAVFPALSVVRIVFLVSDCAHTTSPQQTNPRICPSSSCCTARLRPSLRAILRPSLASSRGHRFIKAHCNAQGRLPFRGLILHRWCAGLFIPSTPTLIRLTPHRLLARPTASSTAALRVYCLILSPLSTP